MKQISGYEMEEYTYDNKQEREEHVEDMYDRGFEDVGSKRRLKEGASIHNTTDEDFEYYGKFVRYSPINN